MGEGGTGKGKRVGVILAQGGGEGLKDYGVGGGGVTLVTTGGWRMTCGSVLRIRDIYQGS